MQEIYSIPNKAISNKDRTERTIASLKEAMRALVLEKGYNQAATPEIVRKAGVTRGALYHHFADKKELFHAVVEDECKAVAGAIERQSGEAENALQGLKMGSDAFIIAMAEQGRTHIILVEAPSVLGRDVLTAIEGRYARGMLGEGLEAAMEDGGLERLPVAIMTELLSAMFDNAALQIESGASRDEVLAAVHQLIDGLAP
jgi:AcrR family transcriptional regulator